MTSSKFALVFLVTIHIYFTLFNTEVITSFSYRLRFFLFGDLEAPWEQDLFCSAFPSTEPNNMQALHKYSLSDKDSNNQVLNALSEFKSQNR